MKMVSPG